MSFDAYMKIDGIAGESTDDKHKEWIELKVLGHVMEQTLTTSASGSGGPSAGKSNHQPFRITKELDKASPKLALNLCNGAHIKEIQIELCRSAGTKETYMKYKLSDVIVAYIQLIGKPGGEDNVPLEEVSFAYGKIEWTYTETDNKTGAKKGDIATHWSRIENKGG